MELFIKVFFWVGLCGCLLRLLLIAIREYPFTEKRTLGHDIACFVEVAFFTVWAGVLLWAGCE